MPPCGSVTGAARPGSRPRRPTSRARRSARFPTCRARRSPCTRRSSAAASGGASSWTTSPRRRRSPGACPGRCSWSGRGRTISSTASSARRPCIACGPRWTATGQPLAWQHRLIAASMNGLVFPLTTSLFMPEWVPKPVIAGLTDGFVALFDRLIGSFAAREGSRAMPYAVPNVRVDLAEWNPGVPISIWRSVGHSYTCFVIESFIDELAAAAGEDPAAFRRRHLKDSPRHLGRAGTRAGEERLAGETCCRPPPRPRHTGGLRQRRGPGRRGVGRGGQRDPRAPGHLRRGLRHRHQPGHRPPADGRRHPLRPVRRAVRRDHAGGRRGQGEQLPRLPAAAPRRVAGDRRAHRAEHRAAERRRRARRAAHRPAVANAVFAVTGQRLRTLPLRLS